MIFEVGMRRSLFLIGFVAAWIIHPCQAATTRVALVVGAASYAHAPTLAHTLNDARDIAETLRRLNFDVDLVLNPDRATLENAVRTLGRKSRGADVSLFYFSGHALESGGINWLLPVSADVQSNNDLRFESLDLDAVLEQTTGTARVSLIFLDACREDPFKQRFGVARDLTRSGLAAANAIAAGSYIAFATAPGMVAADGDGPHSPFTGALLKYIETPGLEVRQMLSRVRGDVEAATDDKQIPWDTSSLRGDFYFAAPVANDRVSQAITGPNPQVDLDALFWESVKDSKNAKDFNAYLLKFPQGVFAEIARNRLAELNTLPIVPSADSNLSSVLAKLAPSASQKILEDTLAGYQAARPHKSLAAHLPDATGQFATSWVTGEPTEQAAEQDALERCEVVNGAACVLVAVDTTLKYTGGDPPTPRSMPRVNYAGRFDPEHIPYLQPDVRSRADVAGYGAAQIFKAAAYLPRAGQLFIVSDAQSQREAEEKALGTCNADPAHQAKGGSCFLYASGDQVVFPRRSTTVLAAISGVFPAVVPPAVVPQAVVPPAVKPPATDAVPAQLHDVIMAQFERELPAMSEDFRKTLANAYESSPVHKALALHQGGGTYRLVNFPTADGAEQATLEACQIYYGFTCALVAVDGISRADASGNLGLHDMPRVHYAGPFDVERIPTIMPALRLRDDVRSYGAAAAPKAMAIHPFGQLYTITAAANQNEAESRALAACNSEPSRTGANGPCYLYAAANQVVLPSHLRQPLTPAIVTPAPLVLTPAPAPRPPPETLADVLSQLRDNGGVAKTVLNYNSLKTHKALTSVNTVAHTFVLYGVPTPNDAEFLAREACDLQYNTACVSVAVDDGLKTKDPARISTRPMERVAYAGPYRSDMVPLFVRPPSEAIEYAKMRQPKAMAIRPQGLKIAIATAASLPEAEAQALARCNEAGSPFPCILYAANDQTILPQRHTEPQQ
jgi:hypothetical protein